METFNIKEAGSELEKILKEELGSGGIIRLSIDVQIPDFVRGDKQGFYDSIVQLCTYLNRYVPDLNIDIELLKVGQNASDIKLNVDIRVSHPDIQAMSTLITFQHDHIASSLKDLPYSTKFSHGDLWLNFSFLMTVQYTGETEGITAFFGSTRILLAEENELSALTFITLMEEWGCHVTKVSDGLSAIEEVKNAHYNVVLVNIHSSEMNGLGAVRKIRSFDQRIPIIGLISSWAKDHASDAYAAGVNDIVTKPASSCELQKILRKYI